MSEDESRLVADVPFPFSTQLGIRYPSDGSLPTERSTAKMWPQRGKLYLGGLRTFVDAEADLRITVRHPRTKKPLLANAGRVPVADVQAAALNPDARSRRWVAFESHEGLFVPVWGSRQDEDDLEPTYCSEEFPLLVEVEGDAVLHMVVMGADHYTVTRWPQNPNPLGPHPELLGEFREPHGAPPAPGHALPGGRDL